MESELYLVTGGLWRGAIVHPAPPTNGIFRLAHECGGAAVGVQVVLLDTDSRTKLPDGSLWLSTAPAWNGDVCRALSRAEDSSLVEIVASLSNDHVGRKPWIKNESLKLLSTWRPLPEQESPGFFFVHAGRWKGAVVRRQKNEDGVYNVRLQTYFWVPNGRSQSAGTSIIVSPGELTPIQDLYLFRVHEDHPIIPDSVVAAPGPVVGLHSVRCRLLSQLPASNPGQEYMVETKHLMPITPEAKLPLPEIVFQGLYRVRMGALAGASVLAQGANEDGMVECIIGEPAPYGYKAGSLVLIDPYNLERVTSPAQAPFTSQDMARITTELEHVWPEDVPVRYLPWHGPDLGRHGGLVRDYGGYQMNSQRLSESSETDPPSPGYCLFLAVLWVFLFLLSTWIGFYLVRHL